MMRVIHLIVSAVVLVTASCGGGVAEEGTPMPPVCVDKCGDGKCQEMVCMAVGCPCAETPETCPQDCGRK